MKSIQNGEGCLEYYYQKDSIFIQGIHVGGKRGVGHGRDLLEKFRRKVGINQKIEGVISHQDTVDLLFLLYGQLAMARPNIPIEIWELSTLPIVRIFASAQITINSVQLMYSPELRSNDLSEKFRRPFSGHT